MGDATTIEWTDATWNPVTGCTMVSAGCTNCYAMRLAGTRLADHPSRLGLTRKSGGRDVWTGEVRFNRQWLTQPLGWRKPRMIFVCAHGDLFHESVPDEWIDQVFAVMATAPQHIFQVLTKRPARMREYLGSPHRSWLIAREFLRLWGIKKAIPGHCITDETLPLAEGQPDDHPLLKAWPLPNVWLGTSVEDQATADQRIPDLLATPAAVRWISAEPLLGPVDLTWIAEPDDEKDGVIDALLGCNWIDGMGRGVAYRPTRPGHEGRIMTRHMCSSDEEILANRKLDWVVVGGESGPGARPMHPDWARALRDQCVEAGVPYFFKQWGEWAPDDGPGHDGTDYAMDGARCAIWRRGGWQYHASGFVAPLADEPEEWMYFLGKKRAGRLLDGIELNEMPARGTP